MKKVLIAAAVTIVTGMCSAQAADPAARPYWSGFYIGINSGGGSADGSAPLRNCSSDNYDNSGAWLGPFGCNNAWGGTVGGQIGYRRQAANWVFGIEGQGNWANFSAGSDPANLDPGALALKSRTESLGLITGQIGYAWDNVLYYVKGGGAVVGSKYNLSTGPNYGNNVPGGTVLGWGSDTRWGGTVGTGLEVGFASNWSIGVEYDHIFLSGRGVPLTPTEFALANNLNTGTLRVRQNIDIGFVRLNYRFGGPTVARY